MTGRIDLGDHATRPAVVLGSIWVGLSDSGGDTVIVDPRAMSIVEHLGCCSPERGSDATENGSIWSYDTPTGTVERWDARTYQEAFNVDVTDPPFYGGLCMTSIAAATRAVWVTVVASSGDHC
jgi:hypothetical protein